MITYQCFHKLVRVLRPSKESVKKGVFALANISKRTKLKKCTKHIQKCWVFGVESEVSVMYKCYEKTRKEKSLFLDKSLPFREGGLCSRESLQNFVRRNNRSAHDVLAENRDGWRLLCTIYVAVRKKKQYSRRCPNRMQKASSRLPV